MKIGKIISVEFDKFRVKLFHTTKTSTVSIEGRVYYFGNIGSFLKVNNSLGDTIICEVVSILDNSTEAKPYTDFNLDSSRELIIKPIGTLKKDRSFVMGVGVFPSIYSDISIVTEIDIQDILEIKNSSENIETGIHNDITIGKSKNLINYTVKISINKLFNIHTAVLGNSGSGKSNTISHLIQEAIRKKNNEGIGVKFILFDVNGEYKSAFETETSENLNTVFYKPSKTKGYSYFFLPYYLMNLDEWSAFLMASDRTQKPFWDKVLQECYKFYKIKSSTNEDERNEFINYFRYKLNIIISFILSRVDSDTANITSAASALRRIKDIMISNDFGTSDNIKEFTEDIDFLIGKCNLNFGVNNNLETELNKQAEKIDLKLALSTLDRKLEHGNYYDYNFLKTATDLVILEEDARGNSRIREYTATMLSRLDYFLNNIDCKFMKESDTIYLSESDYLEKVFSIGKVEKKDQLIIIDSSEVSRDILELLTSVVSRLILDYRRLRRNKERRKQPIHIFLDEAHRYIKKDSEYLLKENIFDKIAREGRKYSLYLIVSSQRPSELSQTVLSQCGNYIIHRIQNEIDMNYIYSVLPYFSSDYITKIKQAVPGEALVFGNCVPLPLSVKVQRANPEPNSDNCIINEEWYKK